MYLFGEFTLLIFFQVDGSCLSHQGVSAYDLEV